jgi:hypothetical protein
MADEPWPLDVLTPDYLVSGEVSKQGQKWGWTYFAQVPETPVDPLTLTVSAVRSVGKRPAPPGLVGTRASFNYGTQMLAVIPRGPAADAAFDEWATKFGPPVAAEIFLGPFVVIGNVYTPDGTLSVLLNSRLAVAEAQFTRVDGLGDATPFTAPRALLSSTPVQLAVTSSSA